MAELIPLIVLVLGLLLVGPVLGVVAIVRVNRLARRLAELERRPAQAPREAAAVTAPVAAPADAPAEPVREPEGVPLPTLPPLEHRPARPTLDWEALIAGRWLNRVGLLAVAIGASYFLKYAIDNDWIGPHGQVALGVLVGAGLVLWSASFERRHAHYFADGIAGLGAAILYLSLWAGTSFYRFIANDAGFIAMVVVTAAMVLVAFGRNRAALAALALVGGFLTPWLVSTGRDAQVVLFSYLALLNTALVATASLRNWRFVEIAAFVFTQIYFWVWYATFYSADVLTRTTLFAALFFSQFSILPAIRARRFGVVRVEHAVLLLVNVALFLLALRATLWQEHKWILAFAVLVLALAHLGLARIVPEGAPASSAARLIPAGLAVTLTVVAIAVRLESHWMTLAWAVEAGVLAWTGFYRSLAFARRIAYLIFVLVSLRLLAVPLRATEFLFNARLATVLLVAASVALAVRSANRGRDRLFRNEGTIVAILAVAANVLMIWALTLEVDLYFGIRPGASPAASQVLFARSLTISLLWTIYASALVGTGVRVASAAVRWQGLALFGVTTFKVFFADLGYLSGFYRIVSSIALGSVLLIVSFFYQRSIAARRVAQEKHP